MADLRVSDLPPLDAVDVEAVDPLLISDISASESKKIDVKSLTTAGVQLLDDGTIPSSKLAYPLPNDSVDGDAIIDNSLPGDKIEDGTLNGIDKIEPGTVDTDQLADGAVSDPKLERLSVKGGATGAIAVKTITADNLADGSVGADALQPITGDSLADLTVTDAKIGSVDGSKINADSITAGQIGPGAVGNSELAADAVNSDNIIPESIVGGENGDISGDTITEYNLADDSVGADQLQPIENESIADGTIGTGKFDETAVDRGLDLDTGSIGHTNAVTGALHNGISFDDQGHIFDTAPLLPSDLPIATTTDVGGVIVSEDGGLTVTPLGELGHTNTVTGDTVSGIEFDDNGHIISASPLGASDLPPATETDLGAVSVPGPKLTVNGSGEIGHALADGLVADTYTKVTVDEYGHVTAGNTLNGTDIPEHSADLITSGHLPVNETLDPEGNIYGDTLAIADNSITGRHIRDYTTCLMQEGNPGATDRYGDPHFLGRYWFQPSTSQLHIYARGSAGLIWLPVGFGVLTQQNLRFAGTYDASTSSIQTLSNYGVQAGLEAGSSIPVATDSLAGLYLICQTEGDAVTVPNVESVEHTLADWIVCLGASAGWVHIDNAAGGGGGGGGGAQRLNDLLDVSLGDGTLDSRNMGQPRVALQDDQLLKYNTADGTWRNTSIINCGTF